ncbi:tigger transposable element-derived protein 6-like [Neodiprion pinetum]|uniref:tigger transposable element-derived protein 6-like n=1 Tax=Neodiprion pinetum TaxID=441929 RepID=UPI001EE075FC|nr:uncharacterized protein LOC124219967 [Neodiprion pinetum]
MGQGVINNFKVYYRKEVVQFVLKSIEENKIPEINILQAMRFAKKPWFNVSKITIGNCLKKAGFKVTEVSEPEGLREEEENCETLAEWNQITACSSNENEQQPTFEGFVQMEDDVLVSEELTDDDIVSGCSLVIEEDEEGCETCEETSDRVSKRDAEKALETLHKYFELSNIDNPDKFDQIYAIENTFKQLTF